MRTSVKEVGIASNLVLLSFNYIQLGRTPIIYSAIIKVTVSPSSSLNAGILKEPPILTLIVISGNEVVPSVNLGLVITLTVNVLVVCMFPSDAVTVIV
jgi:hypothetical protein